MNSTESSALPSAIENVASMNNKFTLTLSIERADGKKEKFKHAFTLEDCVKSKSCFIEIMKAAMSVSDQLVDAVKTNASKSA